MCDVLFKPILKPACKDRTDSSNYRAIAYGSLFFKLFEIIFIEKFGDRLETSCNQFGFKKGHSTTNCCLVLIEIVIYYVQQFSLVFACFLDCSKAFDMVNYDKLFAVLLHRGIEVQYVSYLRYVYLHQSGIVSWNGSLSHRFPIRNGVRQGGVLSPYLFAIYIDTIVDRLRESCCGCYFGLSYVGILIYADDMVLLSPSLRGLRRMVSIASDFSTSLNLFFNPNKSVAMCFGTATVHQYHLQINGTNINWVNKTTYLGHTLTNLFDHEQQCRKILCEFYARANALLASFRSFDLNILLYLFNMYCCPLYGILCSSLSDNNMGGLYVAWNKVVRKMLRLPYRTHTVLLPQIMASPHIKFSIFGRFLKFAYHNINSKNTLVRSVAASACRRRTSLFGANLAFVLSQQDVTIEEFYRYSPSEVKNLVNRMTHVDVCDYRAGFIRDLVYNNNTNTIDRDHFRAILDYLCCSR
jgi:hypothetical protein